MKNTKGITLVELMISISLLTLILFAGGGIYLSGWNMFRDAQIRSQAHRNAMIPMTHMTKHLQQAIRFAVNITHPTAIIFMQYIGDAGELGEGTTISRSYVFEDDQIRYYPSGESEEFDIIGTHIPSDDHNTTPFTVSDGVDSPLNYGTVVNISITAYDNHDDPDNAYTINTTVTARYGPEPPLGDMPLF